MTSGVAAARPEEVLRGAALLGATSDELGTAISACRRSATVRWVGRANEQYQGRLAGLADDLVRVRTAFDAACEALLSYARALAYAQPLAEEAALRSAVGDVARVPDLEWEATQAEQAAAARLIVVLSDLVERAPRTSGWTSVQHDLANFATGLDDAVKGVGATIVSAFRSLPGVGSARSRSSARDEVVQAAKDSVQPWKQVQELLDAIEDGRGWRTSGEVAGAALFRFRGAHGKTVDLFSTHDELPVGVMGTLVRGTHLAQDDLLDAALIERLRRDFVSALLAFEHVVAPTLDELLDGGVDLLHHEAGAGHTLLKHVGRDLDFLRHRQLLEPRGDGTLNPISSFGTIDLAETAIERVLRANVSRIDHWLRTSNEGLLLTGSVTGSFGLLIDEASRPREPSQVIVRLVHDSAGKVQIRTAYLDM